MNKEIKILYPNDNFDLRDFYPEKPDIRLLRRQKIRMKQDRISKSFICFLKTVVFLIFILISAVFFLIQVNSMQKYHLSPDGSINPNNKCGISPSTGERLYSDCSFSMVGNG